VAFYIDRTLDWYLKPPTAGRFITNKQVWAYRQRHHVQVAVILMQHLRAVIVVVRQ
jgi:hypothetical protein